MDSNLFDSFNSRRKKAENRTHPKKDFNAQNFPKYGGTLSLIESAPTQEDKSSITKSVDAPVEELSAFMKVLPSSKKPIKESNSRSVSGITSIKPISPTVGKIKEGE